MSKFNLSGIYFCGNKASDYAIEKGFLDYATLAKSFDAVLNNDIIPMLSNKGFYFDVVCGSDYDVIEDSEGNDDIEYKEFYQYYIISESGFQILKDYTDECVYYNEELDVYIWAVDHYGTAWSYVLTDIKLNCNN